MKIPLKQLFLFLIPTLIVAVVFIIINQQNLACTDDAGASIANIEVSDYYIKHNPYTIPTPPVVPTQTAVIPLSAILIAIPTFIFLLKNDCKLCEIKNHSPPPTA